MSKRKENWNLIGLIKAIANKNTFAILNIVTVFTKIWETWNLLQVPWKAFCQFSTWIHFSSQNIHTRFSHCLTSEVKMQNCFCILRKV